MVVTIRLFEVSFHYTQNGEKVAYRILLSLSNLETLKEFNSAHIMVRMKSWMIWEMVFKQRYIHFTAFTIIYLEFSEFSGCSRHVKEFSRGVVLQIIIIIYR